MSIYDFSVKTNSGEEKSLAEYKGKVLLIVNTASRCGFTPQYQQLQELYVKYQPQGFEILGFPSNQFAEQEPGTNTEIEEFCRLNYGVSFQIFEKGDVRGEHAHPLFSYLTAQIPFRGFDEGHPLTEKLMGVLQGKYPQYLKDDGVKWNFSKFLVDREGKVVARFESTRTPISIEGEIEQLL